MNYSKVQNKSHIDISEGHNTKSMFFSFSINVQP